MLADWQFLGREKITHFGEKRYWAKFTNGKKIKMSRRSFKTATHATNYGRGVIARYESMKAPKLYLVDQEGDHLVGVIA